MTALIFYVTYALHMMNDKDMDAVFQALAHESRRRMLDIVKEEPGIGVGALASEFDVSRIAVMKHLAVLEEAGLIISEKDGRVRKLYFNAAPIQMIHGDVDGEPELSCIHVWDGWQLAPILIDGISWEGIYEYIGSQSG